MSPSPCRPRSLERPPGIPPYGGAAPGRASVWTPTPVHPGPGSEPARRDRHNRRPPQPGLRPPQPGLRSHPLSHYRERPIPSVFFLFRGIWLESVALSSVEATQPKDEPTRTGRSTHGRPPIPSSVTRSPGGLRLGQARRGPGRGRRQPPAGLPRMPAPGGRCGVRQLPGRAPTRPHLSRHVRR